VPIRRTSRALRALICLRSLEVRRGTGRLLDAEQRGWNGQFVREGRDLGGGEGEDEKGARRVASLQSFVQGEFVDNIPRLPDRIINHLFLMN